MAVKKKDIKEIARDVVKIIQESKATFFVNDKNVEIPPDELMYELRAEICTNVEQYFYELISHYEKENKKS